ncbi:MAG: LysR family transcriptional regulator [Deltaproteobacteria bacterium]|nr:MAG: LysR family transcriptional regulator [Deltaproteobacteria bacterium]
MEWQQILGFYQIAKLGSFTRAAKATFRTQSAISQQIKSLEEELGFQLFERIGRSNLKLTKAGESFLRFSVTLLDTHDQLVAELKELGGQRAGRIKIAAPFETFYYLIPNNLQNFTSIYPNIELSIIHCPTTEIVELVKYGEIDFGLAMEYVIPRDLTTIRWKRSERFLMTPIDHPLLKIKRVKLRQIVRYPLILPPKIYPIRKRFDEKLEQLNLKCRIAIESPNVLLCAQCVELGLGVSIISEGLAQRLRKEKRKISLIPLDRQLGWDYVALVMRKDKKLLAYQKAFINIFLGAPIIKSFQNYKQK